MSEIQTLEVTEKKRGQRGGNEVGCRARLRGWLYMVAERSRIWGDVNIEKFCGLTGYSREHVTRELTRLRKTCDDLAFETKMRKKLGKTRAVWGVIVASKAKLDYDRCSLFYSKEGKQLHNRTKLGNGGEKIDPNLDDEELKKSTSQPSSSKNNSQVCDNPKKRKISFGKQQFRNSADRGFEPKARLRKKAFALLEILQWEHWDNCKVRWNPKMAYCYLFQALEDGHGEKRILFCYQKALTICHSFAVDQRASRGHIVFFSLSSTVSKARKQLLTDGLSKKQRIRLWYEKQKEKPSEKNISLKKEVVKVAPVTKWEEKRVEVPSKPSIDHMSGYDVEALAILRELFGR